MTTAIASVDGSVVYCALRQWEGQLNLDRNLRVIKTLRMIDPVLKVAGSGAGTVAVFGYRKEPFGPRLVHFWHGSVGALTWATLPKLTEINQHVALANLLAWHPNREPSLNKLKASHPERLAKLFESEQKMEDWLKVRKLYWADYGTMLFAALYDPTSDNNDSEALTRCLNFHYDYFNLATPICKALPMNYLANLCGNDSEMLSKLHNEPRCFTPFEPTPRDRFVWPWQQCIEFDGKALNYKHIETTSLCVDIRKSTLAMEMLRDGFVGAFPEFVNAIVEASKEIVFENGGFFDKETGDGVMAHFTDFPALADGSKIEPAHFRAFKAAREIIQKVSQTCLNFQSALKLKVKNFTPAVGLHTDKAVWVCEADSIKAVGASAIMASRLCAEAKTRSIFVSNDFFERLSCHVDPKVVAQFYEKDYLGKEYGDNASLAGYELDYSDQMVFE